MPSSYTPDVIAIVRANGCSYVRTGRHPFWYSPISNCHFPVPNQIKSRHTANAIMKQTGVTHEF